MRKYHKLNTQLALQGQKKLLEKKWLEEHNTVDGGQQRASRMTTSKTKTATDVLQETGKIEFEDAQVG